MNNQTSPEMNQKSGRAYKKLGHFAKTDFRFRQDLLFRETYRKNGRSVRRQIGRHGSNMKDIGSVSLSLYAKQDGCGGQDT
jgi:hypothetical protein